jgi:hypothetical protein
VNKERFTIEFGESEESKRKLKSSMEPSSGEVAFDLCAMFVRERVKNDDGFLRCIR